MIKSCRRYWSAADRRFDRPTQEHPLRQPDVLALDHVRPREISPGCWSSASACRRDRDGLLRHGPRNEFLRRPGARPRANSSSGSFPAGEDIVRLLMEPITYANGSTLEDPALSYGIVFSNFMSKGVYTFQGGTDRLIELMERRPARQRRRYPHPRRRRADRGPRRPRGRAGGWPQDQSPGGRLQRQLEGDDFQSGGRRGLVAPTFWKKLGPSA